MSASDMTAAAAHQAEQAMTAVVPWSVLREQAEVMAASSMVATQYRKKPNDVMAAGLMGQELGWGIATAMRFIHVIEGKPSVSPEGMLALVRRAGHSVAGESSTEGATVHGKRVDTGDEMTVTFTMEDARRASLHTKNVWKSYPQSMCWARALSQLCRMLFSDVLLGVAYTPEEFDAPVNRDGDVIDAEVVDEEAEAAAAAVLADLEAMDDVDRDALWAEFLTRCAPTDGDGHRVLREDEGWRNWLVGAVERHAQQAEPAPVESEVTV